MDVKGEVLLQLFNKIKLRNETKTFLESNFFSIVKFKKLGFSAPLRLRIIFVRNADVCSGVCESYWLINIAPF